ncbi:hypothetical protein BO85DRAFT_445033 [Aspergillus piperis CBS 112811]|uniref:Uncharacterized protein n=1 Tax=Aspergillus piperis CBS 112811 TaxID=1448313 RepID=A0A8G1RBW7_9EURO|nr:hypothetical protein BO85DRAFT_445033 [Aspergillus piperis CBS 112811]RAH61590.1 hypothetical protein BO85DRAFT_445033 [Aspergillus piperis CBS 112811]
MTHCFVARLKYLNTQELGDGLFGVPHRMWWSKWSMHFNFLKAYSGVKDSSPVQ